MSQSEFAEILNCSKPQLAMAEIDLRKLPLESRDLLHSLENTITNLAAGKKSEQIFQFQNSSKDKLNKLLKLKKFTLHQIITEEERLQQKITASRLKIYLSEKRKGNNPSDHILELQNIILGRIGQEELWKYLHLLYLLQIKKAGTMAAIEKTEELLNQSVFIENI